MDEGQFALTNAPSLVWPVCVLEHSMCIPAYFCAQSCVPTQLVMATGSNKKVPATTKSRCHFACVQGVLENHPLFLSVFACAAGVSACAWAVLPQMNRLIHFSDFPGERTA